MLLPRLLINKQLVVPVVAKIPTNTTCGTKFLIVMDTLNPLVLQADSLSSSESNMTKRSPQYQWALCCTRTTKNFSPTSTTRSITKCLISSHFQLQQYYQYAHVNQNSKFVLNVKDMQLMLKRLSVEADRERKDAQCHKTWGNGAIWRLATRGQRDTSHVLTNWLLLVCLYACVHEFLALHGQISTQNQSYEDSSAL